ncbi:MAG: Fic family protein [Chloroflexi bacterium]|jgi:Fic family protein|nr:Fic family protein [Chloroflexota bacterium]
MNEDLKALGYSELIKRYSLDVLSPWCESWLASRGERKTHVEQNLTTSIYPPRYDPGDELGDQLTFALKYEGVNLEVLSALFGVIDSEDLVQFIKTRPTGRYTRLTWFFYEWLTGQELPLDNLKTGNYISALDSEKYYVVEEPLAEKVRRQRVLCNLPGTADYCPLVRKTERLHMFDSMKLDERARSMLSEYSEELLYRATQYLFAKETKSSFEIEREHPDKRRTARFVELLRRAEGASVTEAEVVRLQKEIVDERFALDTYRNFQNYVGQSVAPSREIIHYASPKPENIGAMMAGWIQCSNNMIASDIPSVVSAATVGYGFVFLHPFDDGNGRLHRYLIHHVLAKKHFAPSGLIFPVSATMLKNMTRYDKTLECFSRQIMQHVEYSVDDKGEMAVLNDTARFYRYQDMTQQAEGLFEFVRDTIETEFLDELEYLDAFDQSKTRMREIVDMPDRKLDLFIRLSLQNRGRLSKSKRPLFDKLTDDEIDKMTSVVMDVIMAKE